MFLRVVNIPFILLIILWWSGFCQAGFASTASALALQSLLPVSVMFLRVVNISAVAPILIGFVILLVNFSSTVSALALQSLSSVSIMFLRVVNIPSIYRLLFGWLDSAG